MASTYSSTLRLELIGNGDQSGTWGDTTNINLGSLIESAITNAVDITFANATYTLTAYNGLPDEARNAVLNLIGTNSAAQNLIAPGVEKVYIVRNATGAQVTIKTSGGTGVAVATGTTRIVWCDGTDFYTAASPTAAGTGLTLSGDTLSLANTAVTAGAYTAANVTVDAQGRLIAASSNTLGTIASQNANNVTITGGSITGITDLAVADGGTGSSSLTANAVLLGNGTSAIQTVAPGTSGNVLKSNGTTWESGAGFTWNVQNVQSNTNSYSIPANAILVLGTCYHYMGSNNGSRMSVNIKNSGGSTLYTYELTGGNENAGGDGGSGMSSRSAWSVAIPAAAQGGTLEFFQSSGSNGFSNTVNQVVLSA